MATTNKPNNRNGSVEKFLDLDKIWVIIIKNWIEMNRDKTRLVPLIMFPVLMIVIFGYTSGAVPKNIPGAIVDYDNSQLSMQVEKELYANQLFSIAHKVGSQEEGRKLIDSGQIKILFIIPPGFEKDINDGKTAQLSVIVDESDPSVAQITKASTLGAIQRISQTLTAQRLASIPRSAMQVQQQLQSANLIVEKIEQSNDEASKRSMDSNLREAKSLSKKTGDQVSELTLSLRNKLGLIVVPNEVAGINPETGNELAAAYGLLATSDSQAQIIQQIQIYEGLGGSTAKLAVYTQKIYSNGMIIAANSQTKQAYASEASGLITRAQSGIADINKQTGQAMTNPIEMNVIEPYGSGRTGLDFLLPSILALIIFQGAAMGLGRAIAGERQDGSLTRMFLTPTSNVTIIVGTLLFYLSLEIIRSSLVVVAAITFFGVTVTGGMLEIIAIISLYALGSTGVGMIISVIAKSQEQYMAIAMMINFPIIFLSGVFSPIQTLPDFLQKFASILPTTYAADALRGIMIKGFPLTAVLPDIAFLAGFSIAMIALSVILFKREIS
ncbi:ABC transporter permease [Candidatus Micrarchaeota archaeon]|nr:ABC transporter permease [Candidatus Micrarchaeota archaeon]